MFKIPEEYKTMSGNLSIDPTKENLHFFSVKRNGFQYNIIASFSGVWEHVSVYCSVGKKKKTPTWEQMCFVKNLFWDKEDTVVQFHPAENEYVNLHEYALHLWRPKDKEAQKVFDNGFVK